MTGRWSQLSIYDWPLKPVIYLWMAVEASNLSKTGRESQVSIYDWPLKPVIYLWLAVKAGYLSMTGRSSRLSIYGWPFKPGIYLWLAVIASYLSVHLLCPLTPYQLGGALSPVNQPAESLPWFRSHWRDGLKEGHSWSPSGAMILILFLNTSTSWTVLGSDLTEF